jgi:hypothetical protein
MMKLISKYPELLCSSGRQHLLLIEIHYHHMLFVLKYPDKEENAIIFLSFIGAESIY